MLLGSCEEALQEESVVKKGWRGRIHRGLGRQNAVLNVDPLKLGFPAWFKTIRLQVQNRPGCSLYCLFDLNKITLVWMVKRLVLHTCQKKYYQHVYMFKAIIFVHI